MFNLAFISYPSHASKWLLISAWSLALTYALNAQDNTPRWVAGEVMVQLPLGIEGRQWAAQWRLFEGVDIGFETAEQVSAPLNVWLYRFQPERISAYRLLAALRNHPQTLAAQFNHIATLRALPNDSQINSQWQYLNTGQTGGLPDADIDADQAWDITTGGVTITGDTIVVCVIDDGISLTHTDFQRNRWVNRAEIPDNDLDDDNNGYIDDYLGWSTVTDDDNVGTGGNHGTPVAGIVGADGDNGIGVSGVSWRVKVMIVKNNFNTTEAKVLAAYSYPLAQRQRYNQTQGQEGAFVVATNASWGVNGGMAADSPIWCSFYDTLGHYGILNCGATANQNVDVDVVGDLPTTCPSNFLIAVTNTNHQDQKVSLAGYGAESIDLAAPGAGAFTLALNSTYAPFGGTSSATPHVTGTVGLLYSAPCPALMTLAQSDPAAAALLIREVVLAGVDPVASLAGITVTGGRLNAFNSMNLLLAGCGDCIPPSSNYLSASTDQTATLTWNTNASLTAVDLRWRPVGAQEWTLVTGAVSPFTLSSLSACTRYEYQLRGQCNGSATDFGATFTFVTDGCCDAPESIRVENVTNQQAIVLWSGILAATGYRLRWRPQGEPLWQEANPNGVAALLTGLQPCTTYELEVATRCAGGLIVPADVLTFQTGGCGACLDEEYCISSSFDNTGEWISEVAIGPFFTHNSGREPGGYANYGAALPAIQLEKGVDHAIALTPSFSGESYQEAFTIWVDLDQNGFFTSEEKLFNSPGSTQPATGALTLPESALSGPTRMRIVMQFLSASDPCPFTNSYGETEDYCIYVLGEGECPAPVGFRLSAADSTTLEVAWGELAAASGYTLHYRPATEAVWQSVPATGAGHLLTGLQPCTQYVLRLESHCDTLNGVTSALLNVATSCVTQVTPDPLPAQFVLYPNPGRQDFYLQWKGPEGAPNCQVLVYDAQGRLWQQQSETFLSTAAPLRLDTMNAPAGLYWIVVVDDQGNRLWAGRWLKIGEQ